MCRISFGRWLSQITCLHLFFNSFPCVKIEKFHEGSILWAYSKKYEQDVKSNLAKILRLFILIPTLVESFMKKLCQTCAYDWLTHPYVCRSYEICSSYVSGQSSEAIFMNFEEMQVCRSSGNPLFRRLHANHTRCTPWVRGMQLVWLIFTS